jgi:glyoxylase-like metal-dependent hydrolase (beta-lactamase superfamily II)
VSHGSPKQEKEDASEEVVEVAPGIRRMQLPIDFTGLGHVNCYALEDTRGVTLIDPGLPGPDSWNALQARLATAGLPLARVHTVVVTHSHPDHFGSAGLLAEETGAEVVTYERFRTFFDVADIDESPLETADPATADDPEPEVPLALRRPRPSPWGGTPLGPPPERLAEMRKRASETARWFKPPRPTVRVADEQRITLGGREWVGIFTPGHTDDHLCLYDEEHGVLLAGDQVLPTITPHVSGYLTEDSLARYVDSLDRLAALPDVRTVLPAHGHPFSDLPGRVDAIKVHHDERLDEVLRISAELGEASVVDISHQLFRPRSWGAMAEDETYAHLEHLRTQGRATVREEAGVLLYRT